MTQILLQFLRTTAYIGCVCDIKLDVLLAEHRKTEKMAFGSSQDSKCPFKNEVVDKSPDDKKCHT